MAHLLKYPIQVKALQYWSYYELATSRIHYLGGVLLVLACITKCGPMLDYHYRGFMSQ